MNIVERLQQEARRHPGATGEGVRIALKVLQECNCGTCEHCDTVEATDSFGYCARHGGTAFSHTHFCGLWETRQ